LKNLQRFQSLPREMKRRVIVRYALFQIPDLTILLLIILALEWWVDLSSWFAWSLVCLWVIKDLIFFLFLWPAYEPSPLGSGRSLIGAEGIVEEELAPSGFVRVRGELWRAEANREGVKVKKGEKVVVEDAQGLTLVVRPKNHYRQQEIA